VDVAADGGEALRRCEGQAYDLVLLDLMLPDTSGVALLRKMLAARPGLQVIVLSAADDRANRVQCLDLGACDFVGKPFDVIELIARVRGRLKAYDRRYLTVGGVTLDLDRLSVTTGVGTVPLAPREFGLLHHLMSRAGEVCSRADLLTRVWGFPEDQGAGLVDVYVSRLRHKLPDQLIETVRNVGYSFTAA
jgi:DNA-binding response OmpR family regulator